jgi:hypothetical protein
MSEYKECRHVMPDGARRQAAALRSDAGLDEAAFLFTGLVELRTTSEVSTRYCLPALCGSDANC